MIVKARDTENSDKEVVYGDVHYVSYVGISAVVYSKNLQGGSKVIPISSIVRISNNDGVQLKKPVTGRNPIVGDHIMMLFDSVDMKKNLPEAEQLAAYLREVIPAARVDFKLKPEDVDAIRKATGVIAARYIVFLPFGIVVLYKLWFEDRRIREATGCEETLYLHTDFIVVE